MKTQSLQILSSIILILGMIESIATATALAPKSGTQV